MRLRMHKAMQHGPHLAARCCACIASQALTNASTSNMQWSSTSSDTSACLLRQMPHQAML